MLGSRVLGGGRGLRGRPLHSCTRLSLGREEALSCIMCFTGHYVKDTMKKQCTCLRLVRMEKQFTSSYNEVSWDTGLTLAYEPRSPGREARCPSLFVM